MRFDSGAGGARGSLLALALRLVDLELGHIVATHEAVLLASVLVVLLLDRALQTAPALVLVDRVARRELGQRARVGLVACGGFVVFVVARFLASLSLALASRLLGSQALLLLAAPLLAELLLLLPLVRSLVVVVVVAAALLARLGGLFLFVFLLVFLLGLVIAVVAHSIILFLLVLVGHMCLVVAVALSLLALLDGSL